MMIALDEEGLLNHAFSDPHDSHPQKADAEVHWINILIVSVNLWCLFYDIVGKLSV